MQRDPGGGHAPRSELGPWAGHGGEFGAVGVGAGKGRDEGGLGAPARTRVQAQKQLTHQRPTKAIRCNHQTHTSHTQQRHRWLGVHPPPARASTPAEGLPASTVGQGAQKRSANPTGRVRTHTRAHTLGRSRKAEAEDSTAHATGTGQEATFDTPGGNPAPLPAGKTARPRHKPAQGAC